MGYKKYKVKEIDMELTEKVKRITNLVRRLSEDEVINDRSFSCRITKTINGYIFLYEEGAEKKQTEFFFKTIIDGDDFYLLPITKNGDSVEEKVGSMNFVDIEKQSQFINESLELLERVKNKRL